MNDPVLQAPATVQPAEAAPSLAPEVTSAAATPTNAAEATAKVQRLQGFNLKQLEDAMTAEKSAGTFDESTAGLYSALAGDKVNHWLESTKDLPVDAIYTSAKEKRDTGELPADFLDTVVKDQAFSKAKAEHDKPFGQKAIETVKALPSAAVGAVTGILDAVKGAGSIIGTQIGSQIAGDTAESEKQGNLAASAIETGVRRGVGLASSIAGVLVPDSVRKDIEFKLNRDIGGAVPQKALETEQLNAGNKDAWWATFNANRDPLFRSEHGAGVLAKKVGLDSDTLAKEGIKITPDEQATANNAAFFTDPTIALPVHLGVNIAAKGARVALQSTEAGSKVLGYLDKAASAAKQETLAPKLATGADEVANAADDLDRYNTVAKQARVNAGTALTKLGTAIKNFGVERGATGAAAAGVALLSGADPKEAVMAGLTGTALSHAGLGKLGRYAIGSATEKAGSLLRADLPLPFETARKAWIDFSKEYRPLQTAATGAAAGAAGGLILSLGADDPQSKAGLIAGGGVLGGLGALGQRVGQSATDAFVKRSFGGSGEDAGPVRPNTPLGTNAAADAINSRAENELSQSGLKVARQAREVASAFGGESYVARSDEDFQALHDALAKTKRDVSGAAGAAIKIADSVSGKPVTISKIGGANSQSAGHEVTHLMINTLKSLPAGKPFVDRLFTTAANSLGATWDANAGQLKYTSPLLDQIQAHYQSISPTGARITPEYALEEWIAEHGSVAMSGAPAGKLGGSSATANVLSKAVAKFGDALLQRKKGLADSGVTTSEALPYSPDFDLYKAVQNTMDAGMYERSADVPDASLEQTLPPQPKSTSVPVRPEAPVFSAGEGILKPIPMDLATDTSLGNPPVPTPKAPARPVDERAPNPLATPSEVAAPETSVNGAIRGQEVQAARSENLPPLSATEEKTVQDAQPDVAKQGVARKVWQTVKALGGQRIGLPIFEASINQDGVVRSKRVAPYAIEVSSTGKPTVLTVDMDRANYNGKLLFDWAASKGDANRFGYTGTSDPKFVADMSTYLRNQAEGRRGSGEKLVAEGVPPSTGEPTAKITREQEQFFNILMGQTPPRELTTRSAAAIGRIRATAKASGIEPLKTETGSVEPNALRDALSKEGAPIDQIGADPDPTRRQTNPKDRNSVIARIRLQDFESLKPTGQSTSQPNTRAIEASFMPPASRTDAKAQKDWLAEKARTAGFTKLEDVPLDQFADWAKEWRGLQTAAGVPANTEQKKFAEFKKFFTDVTKGTFGKSDKPFVPELGTEDPASLGIIASKQKHSGNFDDHIMKSIPTFYESQIGTIKALSEALPKDAKVLDIAASEGSWGKALTEMSGIHTVSLDPNQAMAKFFAEKSQVPGAEYSTEAFQHGFEDDGRQIQAHDPAEKYDAIHEAMGFQFISPDRAGQIAEAKRLLKPDGLLVTEQKLKNPDWAANEKFKDTNHKNKYFTSAELAAKDKVVGFSSEAAKEPAQSKSETAAVGMVANQVEQGSLESVLSQNFEHVVQYWDSGNFKGYVASDSKAAIDKFTAGLPDLNSKFSTVETPRVVQEGRADSESVEGQSLKANEAADSAAPRFMPAGKTDSPEFKKWFGDSKVVDADGKPMVVYHGTAHMFDAFDPAKIGSTFGIDREGFYFTNDKELANKYADAARVIAKRKGQGASERVVSAYVALKNPWIIEVDTEVKSAIAHFESGDGVFNRGQQNLVDYAKDSGYDGIIIRGHGGANSDSLVIAFGPAQVKSVDNTGSFDATNPDIRFMPSLASAKVKTKDTQFKRERPIPGAVGGVLDLVHFSSKNISELDPQKSFGKGAATPVDRMGAPKAFFYVKGTAYEAPIASRSNVYTAKVDGNSIYDLNADKLGVQSIVNREKRDQAIKDAGFKGFHVETPGFDAVAIYDPVKVEASTKQEVMTPRQMKALGVETPAQMAKREAADAKEYARFQKEGTNDDGTPRFMPSASSFLSEAEVGKNQKALRQRIDDLAKELPSDKQFEEAARLGMIKKGWYSRAAKAIDATFGPDTEKFVGVLAATSPRQRVEDNFKMSLNVWEAWDKAGRPSDPQVVKDLVSPIVNLEARTNNTVKALLGETSENSTRALDDQSQLSGFKVESFRRNLMNDLFAVTNDTWMSLFGDVDQAQFGNRSGYLAFTGKVRRIAKTLDIKPAEVQETIWSFFKTLTELSSNAKPAAEVLASLSEKDVASTPEFYELLLNDPQIVEQLDRLGYKDLEKLRDPEFEALKQSASDQPMVSAEAGRGGRVLKNIADRADASRRQMSPEEPPAEAADENPFMPVVQGLSGQKSDLSKVRVGAVPDKRRLSST